MSYICEPPSDWYSIGGRERARISCHEHHTKLINTVFDCYCSKPEISNYPVYCTVYSVQCTVGWSKKYRNSNLQNAREDSEPCHSTDFRTVFGIMFEWFVSCWIDKTLFTKMYTAVCPFFVKNFKRPYLIWTTSQLWYQNSFQNQDWTIRLLLNYETWFTQRGTPPPRACLRASLDFSFQLA